MKVLYVINSADAQSIPLELGLRLQECETGMIVAGYYGESGFPADHDRGAVLSIGATSALDRKAVGQIFRLIRRECPDIIHVHHAVSALFCWLAWLSTGGRARLVKTEHNDHRFLPWHQTVINYLLYPFLAAIVCNSESTQHSFNWLERLLAGKRSLTIYNGVDVDRVQAAAPSTPHASDGPVVIGHTGRLVPQKNQMRLIRALALARANVNRDIRIEIMGAGKLEQTLREMAAEQGVADALILHGAVSRGVVYEALHRWDAFVMPSIFEGFCNALVEAMVAGLPVACSDIITLREVAGPNAARFDPKDEDAMAAALIAVADQSRNLDRDFAIERYSMTRAVQAHLDLYGRITSRG